jgi:Methyltransferase domain
MPETSPTLSAQVAKDLETIKGWFNPSDRRMFSWLLQRQLDRGESGNLVELGCYLGKSAVLVGDYLTEGETFTVLDLFESDAPDEHNIREMHGSYRTLTQRAFEENYLRFHGELPVVVRAPSSEILDHVAPASCRFVHVDASHLYEHVATDIESAQKLLRADGIVSLDDYRSEHTPGVSAAVWEAMLNKGLQPICVTESKYYGTWGDPGPIQDELRAWVEADEYGWCETQHVAGRAILRVKLKLVPPTTPASTAQPGPATTKSAAPKSAAGTTPSRAPSPTAASNRISRPARTGLRKVAHDWLPPVIHKRVARAFSKRH